MEMVMERERERERERGERERGGSHHQHQRKTGFGVCGVVAVVAAVEDGDGGGGRGAWVSAHRKSVSHPSSKHPHIHRVPTKQDRHTTHHTPHSAEDPTLSKVLFHTMRCACI